MPAVTSRECFAWFIHCAHENVLNILPNWHGRHLSLLPVQPNTSLLNLPFSFAPPRHSLPLTVLQMETCHCCVVSILENSSPTVHASLFINISPFTFIVPPRTFIQLLNYLFSFCILTFHTFSCPVSFRGSVSHCILRVSSNLYITSLSVCVSGNIHLVSCLSFLSVVLFSRSPDKNWRGCLYDLFLLPCSSL